MGLCVQNEIPCILVGLLSKDVVWKSRFFLLLFNFSMGHTVIGGENYVTKSWMRTVR